MENYINIMCLPHGCKHIKSNRLNSHLYRKNKKMDRAIEVGKRLKYLRNERQNMSQSEFSASLDVPHNSYSRYERGIIFAPGDFLIRVCEKYGILPEWLMLGTGLMTKEEQRKENEKGLVEITKVLAEQLRRLGLESPGRFEREEFFQLMEKVSLVLRAGDFNSGRLVGIINDMHRELPQKDPIEEMPKLEIVSEDDDDK